MTVNMSVEIKNAGNRVEHSASGAYIAVWLGREVYENGRLKKFETERDAWEYLARCDTAGKIIR